VGVALALPGGRTFASGRHQLVVLTFARRTDASDLPLISFTDLPIAREVVDVNANPLKAIFKDASAVNPLEETQLLFMQPYSDGPGRLSLLQSCLRIAALMPSSELLAVIW
jgi:hypothetical protein